MSQHKSYPNDMIDVYITFYRSLPCVEHASDLFFKKRRYQDN